MLIVHNYMTFCGVEHALSVIINQICIFVCELIHLHDDQYIEDKNFVNFDFDNTIPNEFQPSHNRGICI